MITVYLYKNYFFSEMNMIMQLIVLKESLLHPINKKLSSANLQQPYWISVVKTFSVEQGVSPLKSL